MCVEKNYVPSQCRAVRCCALFCFYSVHILQSTNTRSCKKLSTSGVSYSFYLKTKLVISNSWNTTTAKQTGEQRRTHAPHSLSSIMHWVRISTVHSRWFDSPKVNESWRRQTSLILHQRWSLSMNLAVCTVHSSFKFNSAYPHRSIRH